MQEANIEAVGIPATTGGAGGSGGGMIPPNPGLSSSTLQYLGNSLRAMYERRPSDPAPEHLRALLDQMLASGK
jgi:hypothetical protein